MMKYLIVVAMMLTGGGAWTQTVQDSLPATDTVKLLPKKSIPVTVTRKRVQLPVKDTVALKDTALPGTRRDTIPVAAGSWLADSFRYVGHPYFRFTGATRRSISERVWQGKEVIFYSLIALLIFFAVIKNGFYRYLQDLTKIFFRTTLRQRQLRDQLVQTPLPSLLLNIFFLLSTGMFLALLLRYFALGLQFHFWILFLYAVAGLILVYAVKFVLLKLMGWTLQQAEATDAYIFIVFTTNKIIGIALLPFLIVLAFTDGPTSQAAVTLGISVMAGLLAYRYFLAYISIHRQVRISFFHFLLYLCAFEIVPLLLINKLLFTFLR
jgi:hypothetical protein